MKNSSTIIIICIFVILGLAVFGGFMFAQNMTQVPSYYAPPQMLPAALPPAAEPNAQIPQPQVPQTQQGQDLVLTAAAGATNNAHIVETQKAGMTARANPTMTLPPPTPLPTLKVYETLTVCINGIFVFADASFSSQIIGELNPGETWNIVGRNTDGTWLALSVDDIYVVWVPMTAMFTCE